MILPPPILDVPTLTMGGVALAASGETTLVEGDSLRLRIAGLRGGETAIVHAFRVLPRYTDKGPTDVTMHAWGEFRAGKDGTVDVDRTRPRHGSYNSASGRGLLWSSYPVTDPGVPDYARRIAFEPPKESASRIFLVLERGGQIVSTGAVRLVGPPGLALVRVHEVGLDGVFAYPKGASRLPVVVSLHGSEGGSLRSAQNRAIQIGGAGFATLAVNYFAYPGDPIPGLPTSHSEIPVETIVRAREWLAKRSEADVDRFGLWGVSKGAEFALLAASTYDWVRAVVAVVPSDVVWEGYRGQGGESGTSSWSLDGKPLPYIPLYHPDPKRFRVNTDRYEASRHDHPVEARAAEIPVERSKARFLLLGSGRDQVWASGRQVRRLVARAAKAGKRGVEAVVFPNAGHFISGTGTFPTRLYGVPSNDSRDPDLTAEGAAQEEGWRRTIDFFRRTL